MVFGPFPWEELLVEEHSMKAQTMPDDMEERREIPSALARLDRCLGDLIETVDSLQTRLDPVLRSSLPVDDRSVPSEALSTDVGRSVDQSAAQVAAMVLRLRELRDRVEL